MARAWRRWLAQTLARSFYAHGMFCATQPILIFCCVFVVVMACAIPLLATLTNGQAQAEPRPILWTGPFVPNALDKDLHHSPLPLLLVQVISLSFPAIISTDPGLRQQLIGLAFDVTKLAVEESDLQRGDMPLANVCFPSPLDESQCLVTSPTQLWQDTHGHEQTHSDVPSFVESPQRDRLGTPVYLDAVVGGVKWGQNNEMVAFNSLKISLFLRPIIEQHENYKNYVDGLAMRLAGSDYWEVLPRKDPVTHCFYEVPKIELSSDIGFLVCSYVIVFLYISFSIGRLWMVKSKFGLGCTAVITLVSSLVIATGICTMLGQPLTLLAVEVVPFLIIAIGMENMLYITNAVVTKSVHLPIKQRVAEGLAQSAGPVVLSVVTELSLAVLGTMFSMPALREFCVFAFFSVLADFFMQTTFFVTVLSIDIRNTELLDLQQHRPHVTHLNQRDSILLADETGEKEEKISRGGVLRPNFSYHSLDAAGLNTGPAGIRACPGLCKLFTALIFFSTVMVGFLLRGTISLDVFASHSPAPQHLRYSLFHLLAVIYGLPLASNYIDLLPPFDLRLSHLLANGTLTDTHNLSMSVQDAIGHTGAFALPSISAIQSYLSRIMSRKMYTGGTVVGICCLLFLCTMAMVRKMVKKNPPCSYNRERKSLWAANDIPHTRSMLIGHEKAMECAHRNESTLVTCSDAEAKVWDLNTFQCLQTVEIDNIMSPPNGHPLTIWAVACSDQFAAVGCSNGCVAVWDFTANSDHSQCKKTPVCMFTHHRDAVTCLAWFGDRIVSGSLDGSVSVSLCSQSNTSRVTATLQRTMHSHSGGVTAMAICSPMVVSGSFDQTVKVTSLSTGLCLHTLYGHDGDITALRVDGPLLISGGSDATVRLWDLASGSLLGSLEGHHDAIVGLHSHFITTANLIISTSLDECRLWDCELQCCLRVFVLDNDSPPPVADIFDGLVAISESDGVCLYCAETGEKVRKIDATDTGRVSPDLFRFVSLDENALVHGVGNSVLVAKLRRGWGADEVQDNMKRIPI